MIKAVAGNAVILGLSDENMKRLSEGKPIKFNLKDLNLPIDLDIVIFNGRTEEEMYKDFLDKIGPNTKMK